MDSIKTNHQTYTDITFHFMLYSFLGWCVETIYCFIIKGYFIKRGLIGTPFCPIYGFGALMIISVLSNRYKNMLMIFLVSSVLCTLLEFISGIVLLSVFNTQLWDYSNEFMNLKGIVCLKNSLFWGLASIILLMYLYPFAKYIRSLIPSYYIMTVSVIFSTYFVVGSALFVLSLKGYSPPMLLNMLK